MSFYYCLKHKTVEPDGSQCEATQRMGPYPTAEAAENWRQTVEERNEAWDDEDE